MAPGDQPIAVLFDLDGTLIDSVEVDAECYCAALYDCWGWPSAVDEYRWDSFADVTDTGILRELAQSRFGRLPTHDEAATFQRCFQDHLDAALAVAPERCRPIAGARIFLERLLRLEFAHVAVATGGFLETARLKWEVAELGDLLPMVGAEGGPSRSAIARKALRQCGTTGEAQTVLVGDGAWDLATAQELGFGFVGRASSDAAERLRQHGARFVFEDFRDPRAVLEVILGAAMSTPRVASNFG